MTHNEIIEALRSLEASSMNDVDFALWIEIVTAITGGAFYGDDGMKLSALERATKLWISKMPKIAIERYLKARELLVNGEAVMRAAIANATDGKTEAEIVANTAVDEVAGDVYNAALALALGMENQHNKIDRALYEISSVKDDIVSDLLMSVDTNLYNHVYHEQVLTQENRAAYPHDGSEDEIEVEQIIRAGDGWECDYVINTNNVWRWLTCWHELEPDQREMIDCLDEDEKFSERIVIYGDDVIDIFGMMENTGGVGSVLPEHGWDLMRGESISSGTVVKLHPDGDKVIVGRFYTRST